MKLSDTDRQILQHIIRYCDEVLATVEMFGDDKQEFLQNFIYRNAVSMPILQVGELANHLSVDFIKAHSEIPWKAIVGMRNRFAHGYQVMNLDEIWFTATNDIPALRQYCRKIIIIDSLEN